MTKLGRLDESGADFLKYSGKFNVIDLFLKKLKKLVFGNYRLLESPYFVFFSALEESYMDKCVSGNMQGIRCHLYNLQSH